MIYESELYHHGIQGQKWGKRNGPPYPLDRKTSKKQQKYIYKYKKQENKVQKAGKKQIQKMYNNLYVQSVNNPKIIKKSYQKAFDKSVYKLNKEIQSLNDIENNAYKKLGEDFVSTYLRKEKS